MRQVGGLCRGFKDKTLKPTAVHKTITAIIIKEKNMTGRPMIDENLDSQTFRNFYYLKEELIAFCRQKGLQTTGGKIELTNRIAHFLETGEKTIIQHESRKSSNIETICEDTLY